METPYWVGVILIATGIGVFVFGKSLAESSQPRQLAFKIKYPNGAKAMHRLPRNSTISLGRAPDNDLMLKDDYVSRNHCVVKIRDDHLEVRDLAATNLVSINGTRVRTGILELNDRMVVGKTELVVVRVE